MAGLPSRAEFIAMMAMLVATIALSLDAMLPALPVIADELGGGDVARAQLVVALFVLGMGVGTFFTGPLSDAVGRKPVVLGGAVIYAGAAYAATQAQTLEALLAARVVQGFGAAGPRVVALAIIRDLFSGRAMARVLSFVMTVFALVPAIAPSVGAVLIAVGGWRLVFWAFILFVTVSATWLALRLPETLPRADRRPFRVRAILAAVAEVARHPMVRLTILVQGLCFGILFAMISSIQPIYEQAFDRADSFPLWFGGVAILAAASGFLNAALVMRLGMRRLVAGMLMAQVAITGTMVAALSLGVPGTPLFVLFVLWQVAVFFQAGMTIGNLNALALEPLGHIAGTAASITSAVATVLAVLFAVPTVLAFDGTPLPLAQGILIYACLALVLMRFVRRAEADLVGA